MCEDQAALKYIQLLRTYPDISTYMNPHVANLRETPTTVQIQMTPHYATN